MAQFRIMATAAAVALCLAVLAQPSSNTVKYNTNRGFIHPGGLHTKADFDRVKAQLAAGNERVKAAYDVLKTAAYAQPTVVTYPVETIVRGGGVGENYMNAARGAAMAYQNALRWHIEGNTACAKNAVKILMAWANTTKAVGGDSNYALAIGLYGYQFAQAAELMRDYDGWSSDDFSDFKQWMLRVWYPGAVGFLRGRNGTWENSSKWWQAPGHYWSNWGLCNALCVAMIGILCDDVYIYNQGMSFFKYDQCGTYRNPRTEVPIKNDGLTEFLGNLVVTVAQSDLETGAYGQLGQMNESGRDTGHSAMALGLAIDLAKVGWNQGDDLFAYMDHRLAAGIEFVAAQTQSIEGLPWTDYIYGTNGYYYTDSRAWTMTAPALGAQMRPYWGTVIGIYEGVKGVAMPFADVSYSNMGIDAGGLGSTSGGYDHLGYSVLMNTRDVQLAPADAIPTELIPQMEYNGTITANLIPSLVQERNMNNIVGTTINHSELGGLVNTYATNNQTCVPRGKTITLRPQLPDGEEDTGLWHWDTGEQTRELTITTDSSRLYRVHYINSRGVESLLMYSIAVQGDCLPTDVTPVITYDDETTSDTIVSVLYGTTVTLGINPSCGYGTYKWSNSKTTQTITTSAITKPTTFKATYINQGGAESSVTFHVDMYAAKQSITVGNVAKDTDCVVVEAGSSVGLSLTLPTAVRPANVKWSTGQTGASIEFEDVQQSGTYTATFTLGGKEYTYKFNIYVRAKELCTVEAGNYLVCHAATSRLLTANGKNQLVTFEPADMTAPAEGQVWYIEPRGTTHTVISLPDSLRLQTSAKLTATKLYSFYVEQAVGSDHISLRTGYAASSQKYWGVEADGSIKTDYKELTDYPFVLIPATETAIRVPFAPTATSLADTPLFDLSGRRMTSAPNKGIYVKGGRKIVLQQ